MNDIVPRTEPALSFLTLGDGRRIAIRHRPAQGERATVVFLPGYASDMVGAKAVAIDEHCAERGLGCLRLDYSGTGESPGDFADGTLTAWLEEVLAAADSVPRGKLLLAGSSMGGWLALHAALARPHRVAALLGIAAAPDFTDWGFTAPDRSTLERESVLLRGGAGAPPTHLRFWRSGQAMRLLEAPIRLAIPVRLVHGAEDEAVPTAIGLRLFDRLQSWDVQLRLIRGAGHRLSEPGDIAAILAELNTLVEIIA